MNAKTFGLATLICAFASTAFSAPSLNISPGGVQAGNWVWDVSITPDLSLVPDSGGTPMAVELGFRLTNDPLVSVSNINPGQFDTYLPGNVIFGWETLYAGANNHPQGIEVNCAACTITSPPSGQYATIVSGTTNEIFAAIGSKTFTTPGAKPFLKIVAAGPGSGVLSSTLQWLGAYGGKGRMSQISGGVSGGPYTIGTYDIFAGSATQSVPEPATTILLGLVGFAVPTPRFRRHAAQR